MSNNKEFPTDNTALAAYLITEGFELQDVIFNGKIATFVFLNDSERLKKCIDDFEFVRAEANASVLIDNYRKLVKRSKRGF